MQQGGNCRTGEKKTVVWATGWRLEKQSRQVEVVSTGPGAIEGTLWDVCCTGSCCCCCWVIIYTQLDSFSRWASWFSYIDTQLGSLIMNKLAEEEGTGGVEGGVKGGGSRWWWGGRTRHTTAAFCRLSFHLPVAFSHSLLTYSVPLRSLHAP